MESPHKGPAARKVFILQFQYFRSAYMLKKNKQTNFTQQWKLIRVLGFPLTGNSTIHTGKNARKHLNSTLLFPYERNPPVTNGLAPQQASDAKALIMQFQDYRSISVSSVLWKKHTFGNSDIAWVSVDCISLATLQFVQQIIPENKNKKKKDTMLHSTDHPSGGKSLVNNGISTQGSELRKFFIMQCQDYQSTFMSSFQKDKLCTQQWQQLSVLGFHLTGRYIVGSTAVSHYWSFMRRIHWWPMDSPHQGPTKRNTLMCNSRSTFASSILCNIKQYFHHSDVICASWASPSLATLMFVHQPVHKNTKENNKAPHRWFPVRRNQQRPMESPHKGPAMWEALIMQFQYFRSTYDGKTHFTQQWKHMHVLGFHLTGNYIVY